MRAPKILIFLIFGRSSPIRRKFNPEKIPPPFRFCVLATTKSKAPFSKKMSGVSNFREKSPKTGLFSRRPTFLAKKAIFLGAAFFASQRLKKWLRR